MDLLRAYLWKEWRDQRVAILSIACVVPFLFALPSLASSSRVVDHGLQPALAASVGMLLALFAVGADLVPGEVRRARVRFLERLPAGLNQAWTAKALALVAVTCGAAIYSAAVASACFLARHGSLPERIPGGIADTFLLPAIGVACWVFAVSCWVPHAALAFPTAAILLGALLSPAWYFYGPESPLEITIVEMRWFFFVCIAGAAISSWAGFVLGHRRGGGQGRAACAGLSVAVLAFAPLWAWSSHRLHEALTLDVHAENFFIHDAYLGSNGGTLYLNAQNQFATGVRDDLVRNALAVDVATGAWRDAIEGGQQLVPARTTWDAGRTAAYPRVRSVCVWNATAELAFELDTHGNLEPARTPSYAQFGHPALEAPWIDSAVRIWAWRGLGYLGSDQREPAGERIRHVDPFRQTVFADEALFGGRGRPRPRVWIRPGSWLIQRGPTSLPLLFDPVTLEEYPAAGFELGESVQPILDDGRVLAAGKRGIFVVDPKTGQRTALRVIGHEAKRFDSITTANGLGVPLERLEPRMVRLQAGTWSAFARVDLEGATILPASATTSTQSLLAIEDSGRFLVIEDHRRIVRLSFGVAEREVVFPRGE